VEYSDSIGWTGGFLVLNASGRPMEFHCTLPVRPTRAHEILFGATLRSHLIGELIGPALLKQTKAKPTLLCVDQPEGLLLREQFEFPVLWVSRKPGFEKGGEDQRQEAGPLPTIALATVELSLDTEESIRCHADVRPQVEALLTRLGDIPDFKEPFLRIREAVREAQLGPSTAAPAQRPMAASRVA
jgi:hypothetical protein